ncbi:MAG: hypothetical protein JJT94_12015 [Bernardetiaceae bacterium]|nr:hypothetical protein [Bernardetiaceae bacterium]
MNANVSLIFLILIFFSIAHLKAQEHMQGNLGLKMGYSRMPTYSFQPWAQGQGVENVAATANNMQIGVEFMITFNKTPVGINLDADLGSRREARPRTVLILAGSGRQLIKTDKSVFNILLNLGFGDIAVRFREQIPRSFGYLHDNDSYAMAYTGVVQPLAQYIFKPTGNSNDKTNSGFMPYISMRVGANIPFATGRWNYGRLEPYDDDQFFVGTPISMPQFYRYAMFAQLTFGFMLDDRW